MAIKQSRKLNKIKESRNTVTKLVLESEKAFKNELYALKLLKKYAPKLLGVDGRFLTLEKVRGSHLSDLVVDKEIMKQVAQGLNYIHSHKKSGNSFIHGDLHKDNIILGRDGLIFLDFSCSVYGDPLEDAAAVEIHLTDNPKLLKEFYLTLNAKKYRRKIDDCKTKHCLRHLEWAEKEGFMDLAQKSKRIINEIKSGKARLK